MTNEEWVPFSSLVALINDCMNTDWEWHRNMKCKYVKLTVDMRNGRVHVANRHGQRISLDELQYQFTSEQAQ